MQGSAQIDFRLLISVAWRSFKARTGYTLRVVFFCHRRKGENITLMMFTGYFEKNNFMMNFRGEKKVAEGFKSSVNRRQIFDMLPEPSALG